MKNIGILNAKSGGWAFEELAQQLGEMLNIPVVESPLAKNYVLYWPEENLDLVYHKSFIPIDAILLASDKRKQAQFFARYSIPTPQTILLDSREAVQTFIANNPQHQWCLKYPTSCGAGGHKIIDRIDEVPESWPTPYIVQEFIKMNAPEVYRLYCAGGDIFGWNVRKFKQDRISSPWVARAQGAVYDLPHTSIFPPVELAKSVFLKTQLLNSFGCVDLIRRESGEWLVLEIGTDGLFNYVDRSLGIPDVENTVKTKITQAFDKYLLWSLKQDN